MTMTSADIRKTFALALWHQTFLHQTFDQVFLNKVDSGQNLSNGDIESFLITYRLNRRAAGQQLSHDKARFWRVCKQAYSALPAETANNLIPQADLNEAWHDANSRFSATTNYYSAFSKMLWFFRPHSMTMFDSLSTAGIRQCKPIFLPNHRPTRPGHARFLDDFEALYATNIVQREIDAALRQQQGANYPYRKRIFDKFLWLAGQSVRAYRRNIDFFTP